MLKHGRCLISQRIVNARPPPMCAFGHPVTSVAQWREVRWAHLAPFALAYHPRNPQSESQVDLKHELEDARVTLKLLEGRDGCQPGPSVELAPAQLPSLILCGVVASRSLEKELFPLLVERCREQG